MSKMDATLARKKRACDDCRQKKSKCRHPVTSSEFCISANLGRSLIQIGPDYQADQADPERQLTLKRKAPLTEVTSNIRLRQAPAANVSEDANEQDAEKGRKPEQGSQDMDIEVEQPKKPISDQLCFFHTKIDGLHKIINELETHNDYVTENLAAANKLKDQSDTDKHHLREKLAQAHGDKEKAEAVCQDLRKLLAQAATDLEKAKKDANEKEKKVSNSCNQIKEMEKERAKSLEEAVELKRQLNEKSALIEAYDSWLEAFPQYSGASIMVKA